jgi:ankyrin repeat protein
MQLMRILKLKTQMLALLLSAISFCGCGDNQKNDGIEKVRPTVISQVETDAALKSGSDDPMALFACAQRGDISRAKELLTAGANPNAMTSFGHYPLHEAASRGDKDMVELLLANGAKVDVRVSPNGPKSPNQWTLLHFATYAGHKEIVEILISKGADVNAEDVWGKRPLYYARDRKQNDIELLLLSKGAVE